MRSELPAIAKVAARVLATVEQTVLTFPRAHRYGVGARLQADAQDICERVNMAWRDRARSQHHVQELVWQIDRLKIRMQLGKDVNAFRSFRQFDALARIVNDLGRQCGGWLKALHWDLHT